MKPKEQELTPKTIANFAQNRLSLIARDFHQLGIPKNITYKILLQRGIFKWMSVRRKIIMLKDKWRNILTSIYHLGGRNIVQFPSKKRSSQYIKGYRTGYIHAMEQCRKEIVQLCHSDRWQAPDRSYDRDAFDFLMKETARYHDNYEISDSLLTTLREYYKGTEDE